MRISLITTGTELLLGAIVNSHAHWIANELGALGLRLEQQTTVPDGPTIERALHEALEHSELVLVTGGLGPTSDDLTRDAAAALFQRPLKLNAAIREKIHTFFRGRNIPLPANVDRQAEVPQGALVLPNNHGTAPGLILESEQDARHRAMVLLPGPPRELHPMWQESVVPWLLAHLARQGTARMESRTWRILGTGESRVQEAVEAPLTALGKDSFEIGYCSRPGEVDLRLIAPAGTDFAEANQLIRNALGSCVYAEGDLSLEAVVVAQAARAGWTLATAESCTGGFLAHRLTNISGSSEVFGFGWVTYANKAKIQELGVPAALLQSEGAVSEPVARAMAQGALAQSNAHLAVALTGIAGPTGGTEQKPVGTVWIGLAQRGASTLTKHRHFPIDRETFKYMASQTALDMLRRVLPS